MATRTNSKRNGPSGEKNTEIRVRKIVTERRIKRKRQEKSWLFL